MPEFIKLLPKQVEVAASNSNKAEKRCSKGIDSSHC